MKPKPFKRALAFTLATLAIAGQLTPAAEVSEPKISKALSGSFGAPFEGDASLPANRYVDQGGNSIVLQDGSYLIPSS